MLKVGMFDSGIGGLFTLCELRRVCDCNVVYLADSKNLPYGNKNRAELISILSGVFGFFLQEQIDVLIAACNTSAVVLLEETSIVPDCAQFKVLNVLEPAVKKTKMFKEVGILATPYTSQSYIYEKLVMCQNPKCRVYSVSSLLLVPLIESGAELSKIKEVLFSHLKQFPKQMEAIVLGCTHYSFLAPCVFDFFCGKVTVIDSATAIFSEWDISREVCGSFTTEFFVTGDVNQFVNGGLKLCDLDFGNVRQVSLRG
ncbi:MAG: aspartate/glutamate racemase family protein [Oscillospiraceae bacterium]|jgi:glutamate racemase|nr:aspartate/glutamate racemase family protein [Oscillospiraceae bacterium]